MDIILAKLIKAFPDQAEFDSESIKSSLIKVEASAMEVSEWNDPAVKIKYMCNAFE